MIDIFELISDYLEVVENTADIYELSLEEIEENVYAAVQAAFHLAYYDRDNT